MPESILIFVALHRSKMDPGFRRDDGVGGVALTVLGVAR